MYSMQFISLDAIFSLITGMDVRSKGRIDLLKPSRHGDASNLPSREELWKIKTNKKVSVKNRLICKNEIFI